ncbi:MAG: Fic family protein [Synergistes sp.]|nr:Fic family protein [Synergistes sp.]
MGYKPPYEINDKIVGLISAISGKIGQVSERNGSETRPHLRRSDKIRSVHSSLRIEANSLSLGEVSDIIDGRPVAGPEKEIQEVKNAYKAYERIGLIDPFSIEDLKQIHGIITEYITEDSGQFRRREEGVFDGGRCIFAAPPAKRVPQLMDDLFAWMKSVRESVHPLILGAVFHYEFVFIHPFSDGNGRTARLWHTAILAEWKPIFEYIPLESRIEKFQAEYYRAIADCHTAGNSTGFIEFMLSQINAALDEILCQTQSTAEEISEYEKRLLNVMEPGVPYTAKALLDLLGLKSKETLRKNYLTPAIRRGLAAMTLPEKPKSKNQRYVKKFNSDI